MLDFRSIPEEGAAGKIEILLRSFPPLHALQSTRLAGYLTAAMVESLTVGHLVWQKSLSLSFLCV